MAEPEQPTHQQLEDILIDQAIRQLLKLTPELFVYKWPHLSAWLSVEGAVFAFNNSSATDQCGKLLFLYRLPEPTRRQTLSRLDIRVAELPRAVEYAPLGMQHVRVLLDRYSVEDPDHFLKSFASFVRQGGQCPNTIDSLSGALRDSRATPASVKESILRNLDELSRVQVFESLMSSPGVISFMTAPTLLLEHERAMMDQNQTPFICVGELPNDACSICLNPIRYGSWISWSQCLKHLSHQRCSQHKCLWCFLDPSELDGRDSREIDLWCTVRSDYLLQQMKSSRFDREARLRAIEAWSAILHGWVLNLEDQADGLPQEATGILNFASGAIKVLRVLLTTATEFGGQPIFRDVGDLVDRNHDIIRRASDSITSCLTFSTN